MAIIRLILKISPPISRYTKNIPSNNNNSRIFELFFGVSKREREREKTVETQTGNFSELARNENVWKTFLQRLLWWKKYAMNGKLWEWKCETFSNSHNRVVCMTRKFVYFISFSIWWCVMISAFSQNFHFSIPHHSGKWLYFLPLLGWLRLMELKHSKSFDQMWNPLICVASRLSSHTHKNIRAN